MSIEKKASEPGCRVEINGMHGMVLGLASDSMLRFANIEGPAVKVLMDNRDPERRPVFRVVNIYQRGVKFL